MPPRTAGAQGRGKEEELTTLYLPIGIPGSGKSTLAGRMVINGLIDSSAIVSPDHFRKVLTGRVADQTMNQQVFQICRTIVDCRLRVGLDVFLDATNLNETSYGSFVALARLYKAAVTCIIFDVDPDTCWNQNRSGKRRDAGAVVPTTIMARMLQEFKELDREKLPGTSIRSDVLEEILRRRAVDELTREAQRLGL